MRCVIQRVSSASVVVEGVERGRIGRGLVVLAGFSTQDTEREAAWCADKVANIRIFEDGDGKMNLSVLDVAMSAVGSPGAPVGLLLIPNFTLAGDARKGRRPSFDHAMRPEAAQPLFERFVDLVRSAAPGLHVATGVFRVHMDVTLTNDGPITIVLDSAGSTPSLE